MQIKIEMDLKDEEIKNIEREKIKIEQIQIEKRKQIIEKLKKSHEEALSILRT